MKNIKTKLKSLIPSKRKLIQLYSALLFNANIKGFFNGRIYQGPLKNICTPGLNCYSCPGASGACPLGSLQNSLSNTEKRAPYYVFGILLLYGILFGRFICGFLCPFGFIQELLHKIKTPKLKKNRFTRVFSWFKYVILVFLVFVVPILYGLRNVPLPGFCKYICPAGTIEGAFGLLSNRVNESELARLGPLFTWKFILTVSIIVGCIFIYRMFCRFLCPLGAIYGLFNRFSILGIKLEKPKCTDCGLCISHCKMDIKHVGDHECISCGECISVCPTKAISFKGGKIILPPDEIAPVTPDMTPEKRAECEEKTAQKNKGLAKRRLITRVTAGILAASLLIGALVYYNFIDKPPQDGITVYKEGDMCPDITIPVFDGTDYSSESFSPLENTGKVTVINFWHTQCTGCIHELPYFDRVAEEKSDIVTVVAVTKEFYALESYDYINTNYKDSSIIFGKDESSDIENPTAADLFFTSFGGTSTYPITVILDREGRIFTVQVDALDYDTLNILVMAAYMSTNG